MNTESETPHLDDALRGLRAHTLTKKDLRQTASEMAEYLSHDQAIQQAIDTLVSLKVPFTLIAINSQQHAQYFTTMSEGGKELCQHILSVESDTPVEPSFNPMDSPSPLNDTEKVIVMPFEKPTKK